MDLMNHASPSDASMRVAVEAFHGAMGGGDEGKGGEGGETGETRLETEYFVCARATRDIQAGTELTFSYRKPATTSDLPLKVEEGGKGGEGGCSGGNTVGDSVDAESFDAACVASGKEALQFLFHYGFVPEEATWQFYTMVQFTDEGGEDGGDGGEAGGEAGGESEGGDVDPLLAKALTSIGFPATRTVAVS
jgi:hypothetical protein